MRNRPEPRDLSIGREVEAIRKSMERLAKRLGDAGALWLELVPAELAAHCRLEGMRGGVLEVSVDSQAARYALDRLLRGGVEASLRARSTPPVAKVRIRVAPPAGGGRG
jgi:hypothetical protein